MHDITPIRPPLSTATQAVWDAFEHADYDPYLVDPRKARLAAALCTAADQVVPDDPKEAMHFTNEAIRLNRQGIRNKFLAIAAELENAL